MEDEELVQAGHMAEEMFVRQLRRRRRQLGISQAELAERVAKLGGSLYQQTIAKMESGQRAIRLGEADTLAKALETTVSGMLSAEIMDKPAMDYQRLLERRTALQERIAELARTIQEEDRELENMVVRVESSRQALRVLHEEADEVRYHLEQLEDEKQARDAYRAELYGE